MCDQFPLTGSYRGLGLVSTVSCTISHYTYRDGKREVILTVSFGRLRTVGPLVPRLVGVLVPSVDGESGGGRSECGDETMPVGSSRGLSVSSSCGGSVRWCSLLSCPYNRLPSILRFVEGR